MWSIHPFVPVVQVAIAGVAIASVAIASVAIATMAILPRREHSREATRLIRMEGQVLHVYARHIPCVRMA